jgi:hypothetical protein
VAKTVFFCCIVFLLDAIVVTRYVFIFRLKNPASFDDEFWCCFITVWIYAASVTMAIAVNS